MSEKAGKEAQSNGGKSALKAKGKENGAGKSRNRKTVQFDSDGSMDDETFTRSNGKAHTPAAKGGKGSKSGKGQSSKEPPPLELRVEQEIPENTKCLLDCEAAEILQGIHEQMVVLSEDPTIKLPVSFDKGLMYAKRHKLYEDSQIVRQTLQPLKEHGVTDGEMCMIANFNMESVDEVFALVPSFKGKRSKLEEPLKNVLEELAKLKNLS